MSSVDREKYEELTELSQQLHKETEQHQQQLDGLIQQKAEFEDKLLGSQVDRLISMRLACRRNTDYFSDADEAGCGQTVP